MAAMLIRFANESDLPRVNELRQQVNDLHVSGAPEIFRPGFNEELQQHLLMVFSSEDRAVLVAEGTDDIVGFACLKFVNRAESAYRKALHYLDGTSSAWMKGIGGRGLAGRCLSASVNWRRSEAISELS